MLHCLTMPQKQLRLTMEPKRKFQAVPAVNRRILKLSRSKIEDFLRCPRCFYLDRRLGISQPPGFPFNLNSAVDLLLKKEFDIHRGKGTAHPLMKSYGINAIPLSHPELDRWREN